MMIFPELPTKGGGESSSMKSNLIRHRAPHRSGFTIITNEAIQDISISLKAKGLLHYILSQASEQDSPWDAITQFSSFASHGSCWGFRFPWPSIVRFSAKSSLSWYREMSQFWCVSDTIKGGIHMARQRKVLPPVKEKRISLRVIDTLYETMAADAEMTSEYRRE